MGRGAAASGRARGARHRSPRRCLDERRRRRVGSTGRRRRQRGRDGERRRSRRAARLLLDRLRLRRPRRRSRTSSRTGRIRSPPTGGRSSTARPRQASERGSSAPRGCSARPGTTSSARCCGSARNGTRSRSSTTSGGRRPIVGHLAAATRQVLLLPHGVYHVAAEGDATWADFAEAIFDEAGLETRRPPDHDGRARASGAATGLLGAAEREGRADTAALARRPSRDDRRHPSRGRQRIDLRGRLLVPHDLDPRRAPGRTSGTRSTRSSGGRAGGAGSSASTSSSTATVTGSARSIATNGAASFPIPFASRRGSRASSVRS